MDERSLRVLIEESDIVVVELDATGCLDYVSANAERLLGYSAERLMGLNVLELRGLFDTAFLEPDRATADLAILRANRPPDPRFCLRHGGDGDERWFEITGRTYETPDGRRGVGIARDVTVQVEASRTLRESEQRRRLLTENTFDMIVEIDSEGRSVFANEQLESVLGYKPADVIGKPLFPAIHPSIRENARKRLEDGRQDLVDGAGRIRVRHANASWRWLEFTVGTFPTESGENHHVLVAHDITERVELEEERARSRAELEARVAERTARLEDANAELRSLQSQLIVAERLAAGAELAGEVAHAVRNPLAALRGTAQMLREELSENPLTHEIERLVERTSDVVERTLSLFQRGVISPEPHPAGDIVAEVVEQVRDVANRHVVRIEADVAEPQRLVKVDRPLLVEALASLANNAVQAMEGTKHRVLGITATHVANPRCVRFEVSDTGPGIPPEARERVFEPFFTTKGGGTGLGLAIARGAVLAHGGTITITGEASGGTTVAVALPLDP